MPWRLRMDFARCRWLLRMLGTLAWPHRDPFDRVLAAQAMLERMTRVSRDPVFAEVPLSILW